MKESQKSLGPQIREVTHMRKVRQSNKLFKSANNLPICNLRTYLLTDHLCFLHSQHYIRTERLLPVPKPNPKHCCFTHYLERPEQHQRTQNLYPDPELKIVEQALIFGNFLIRIYVAGSRVNSEAGTNISGLYPELRIRAAVFKW